MPSYMELIYIDSDDQARQTLLQASRATDAETWAAFKSYRRYAVDIKQADFLLDYHDRKGDMNHTIPISTNGFMTITGQRPKTDAEYRKIDEDYWEAARKEAA